jgi:hypothetical protein
MFALLLTAVAAALTPPAEPLRGQLQSAIWADLQLNAMIGNGNWLASLWYNAGSDTASDLHIRELMCSQDGSVQRCSFALHRDGGPKEVMGEAAPEALICLADFEKTDDGWSISHTRPHKVGHSQTSMRCKTVKQ